MNEKLNKILNKKEQITIFSFVDNVLLKIYNKYNIDIFRFDLKEFADLHNYEDDKKVKSTDFLPILKYLKPINNLLAVDLPLSTIINDNGYSIKNIFNFFIESNADMLCIDINYLLSGLIKSLAEINIPVIISAKYEYKENLEKSYFEKFLKKLHEIESNGAFLIILENFPSNFIANVKQNISIPVITKEMNSKSNGIYIRFSTDFGYTDIMQNKVLNLNTGIDDAVNECIKSINQ